MTSVAAWAPTEVVSMVARGAEDVVMVLGHTCFTHVHVPIALAVVAHRK